MSEPSLPPEPSGEPNDGTIELELTLQDLSLRYAIERQAASSGAVTARLPQATSDSRNANVTAITTARSKTLLLIGTIAITLAFNLLGTPVADRERSPGPLQPSPDDSTQIQAQTLQPEKPQQNVPPVRIKNPFDPSETFEFPPETSRAKARELVADLLLQRARDRGPIRVTAPRRRLGLSSELRKRST